MVFEQLYSADYLRKRPKYGFLLGIGYTILGLFLAIMMFRDDPALIAVGITALFLIPCLYQLSTAAEVTERKLPNLKAFILHVIPYVKVYVYVFFGIFFTFAAFAIFLPKLAAGHLFEQQLSIIMAGKATSFSWTLFWDLYTWNLQVLMLCFVLSLIAGNGAILFIAWNASVWGTIFGTLAKTAALASQANPLIIFLLVILSVFPHTLLEGLSYMLATISGTVLSDGLVREKMASKNMWIIFKYNAILFAISLGILFIGMLVETYVLTNFTTYRTIIEIAFPR
ncbi:MAG TPA: stage II sporulation protein M [Candidatus Nanoarchaeia archaeon]|nr:stage II sporulation protein M [Candidatus Nanoarchaeia archaeon]